MGAGRCLLCRPVDRDRHGPIGRDARGEDGNQALTARACNRVRRDVGQQLAEAVVTTRRVMDLPRRDVGKHSSFSFPLGVRIVFQQECRPIGLWQASGAVRDIPRTGTGRCPDWPRCYK